MDIPALPRQRGFTLLELMSSMSIAVVLTTTAIPALNGLLQRSRITTEINTFVAHLHYARSEAIKRGQRVVICRSADGLSCARTEGWHRGWITFADSNANRERDDGEALLRVEHGEENGIIITSGQRRRVIYWPTGFTPGTNGTYTFCDPDYPQWAKAVILSNPGRPRLSDTKPDGSALDCG
ncbi:GspH/FimT family pseudopilin [Sulfuriflexus mobilis]|uniref:GspH/FimT family pseudopilin n=1 Tax=Sulfuriflexus mobilis TaxID=1811807 RepID=UPI001559D1DF|nr:GspH/FimT family pseudopilin [Sulfuriflexus mobilis]